MTTGDVVVLSGGVGGGRFACGVQRVVDPDALDVVVNTGDDDRLRGLYISPDVDSVLYHLAGEMDWTRGWGVNDETFRGNERYTALARRLGDLGVDLQEWFGLGDLDLATHQLRTRLLDAGLSLSVVTDALRRAMGIPCRVHPMAETPVRTIITTSAGERLAFEDYFVRRQQRDEIAAIEFNAAADAVVSPRVAGALDNAALLLFTPSNPLVSIGPILAVPAIRAGVQRTGRPRVGVSPVIGGKAMKGPADKMLVQLGHESSALGVARLYRGLLDVWVIDEKDSALAPRIEHELGMRVLVCDTVMRSVEDSARLAKCVLEAVWS